MSQQDNDIISMSDLLVTLIKHIKLWLVIVVLGVILSIVYGVKHQDNYEFSANLLGPSYISEGTAHWVMDKSELSNLIGVYYKQYQDANANDFFINKVQFDADKLQLNIKAKKDQNEQVITLLNEFIDYAQTQEQYKTTISNWQENVEFGLKQLQQQNKVYADTVKQFQHNIETLSQTKDLATVNGQALLNNLSNTILSYQSQMFGNDIKIQHYKSQLQTLNKKILLLGGVIKSYKPIGLTSPVIVILGIILSLVLATIIVFIIEFIKNLRQEVKQKLAK
ncbi:MULTISPECIES: hypothetical protein [Cysteiniphilum]|uniref:Polysaccharide chain length determinant N-terminal domain-containing protein n=1 Tax=Cysteiniphilum litorale TaxID=2056700 RepID=A0A8J3E8K4_9GAMM|nr:MULTISPECIES: hypothetical protein [Cysteiniphilum]GGF94619.1 hypothetical protein GCM10010995_09810 [Cysteiniphilum litorale]